MMRNPQPPSKIGCVRVRATTGRLVGNIIHVRGKMQTQNWRGVYDNFVG